MSRELKIVMYHYVREIKTSRYSRIKGITNKEFFEQIEYLEARGCNFISTEQLLDALENRTQLERNSVFLTFDDGYIDHYTNVYPILKQKRIPAFFAMPGKILKERKVLDVNKIHFMLASTPIETLKELVFGRLDHYRGSEFDIETNEDLYMKLAVESRLDSKDVIFIKRLLQVELEETLRNAICDDLFEKCVGVDEGVFCNELYLSHDQIKLMASEGMTFGIHGYEHYWMNRLSEGELIEDIGKAKAVFCDVVDVNRWVCCYPYGSFSNEVANVVQRLGSAAGITTVAKSADLDDDNRFALPRMDTIDIYPFVNK